MVRNSLSSFITENTILKNDAKLIKEMSVVDCGIQTGSPQPRSSDMAVQSENTHIYTRADNQKCDADNGVNFGVDFGIDVSVQTEDNFECNK